MGMRRNKDIQSRLGEWLGSIIYCRLSSRKKTGI